MLNDFAPNTFTKTAPFKLNTGILIGKRNKSRPPRSDYDVKREVCMGGWGMAERGEVSKGGSCLGATKAKGLTQFARYTGTAVRLMRPVIVECALWWWGAVVYGKRGGGAIERLDCGYFQNWMLSMCEWCVKPSFAPSLYQL